jgi:RNA polymerase sigma factor (sigma-70 family)
MTTRPEFDSLIAEFEPMVARICASYERDRDLARELAQDAWLAIWKALPGFRGEASPKTFVARVTQFRAISHVARRARIPESTALSEELVSPMPPPEAQAVLAGERNRLLLAVQHLPLPYRQVVILTLEDFSPPEVAALLGVSANVVAVRLTRARSMLRELLGKGES